ncbi:MAG TPA: hypothetical protein VF482_15590 [Trebonia sp.]
MTAPFGIAIAAATGNKAVLAASSAQSRWLTRYSRANPVTTNCGTTSSVLAPWIRHSPRRPGRKGAARARGRPAFAG